MNQVKTFALDWGGKKLVVEIGKLAPQAHGACTVRYGDTVVLGTVVQEAKPKEGADFFPLLVDFEEKMYAAGKIKGSRFIKREGRASDEAILTARLIDRSLRPLFDEAERRDLQVVLTMLSFDGINDPDIPALLAANIALEISPVNWQGPAVGVRLGRQGNDWLVNPTYEEQLQSDLDLTVVGNQAGEVVMIEAGANQAADELVTEGINQAVEEIRFLFPFIEQIKKEVGQEDSRAKISVDQESKAAQALLAEKVKAFVSQHSLEKIFPIKDKLDYQAKIGVLVEELSQILKEDSEVTKEMRAQGLAQFENYLAQVARELVLEKGQRVDARAFDEIRPLSAEVGVLPRLHGSGLFSRGETQALSIVTLGAPGDEQLLDTMEHEGKKRYMHHYNFPGFSVGEVKPMRGPGRREIGHGALAEKALQPVVPSKEEFPYTIRVVTEILSSNGSTSQAAVCGSTLALMDAGVPIKAMVAGISIGLITNSQNRKDYRILTDIQGMEDYVGDMDFKVAGTDQGITAVQLDIKLTGISLEVCAQAIQAARAARLKILAVMKGAIAAPRAELSPYAPRITTIQINPDKIRDVIGSGGKIIREITETCGVDIDIDDSGLIMVTSENQEASRRAIDWIESLTHEVVAGEVYKGKVTRLMDFGAFVEILPGQEGLVHISEFAWQRVDKIEDVAKVGDQIEVKVKEIDSQGRINLTHKELLPQPENYRPPTNNFNSDRPRRPRFNNQRQNNRRSHR